MKQTINGTEYEIGPHADLRGANLCDTDLRDARITFRGRAVRIQFEEVNDE